MVTGLQAAVIWFARLFPTSVWDWAMRKAGFLSPQALGVTGDAPSVPAGLDVPMPPASAAKAQPRAQMN